MQNSKTKSTVVLAALVGGVLVGGLQSNGVFAQNLNNKVLVIDEGVDLQHDELRNRSYINRSEMMGQKTIDDDRNGFVDDVSGWNILSNDNQYFPARLRKVFADNASTVTELLSLYNRIEEGDKEALEI